ncbi:MAG: hypothetical protein IKO74_01425 [Selenomonadaceae bacterium]|nr:hypothetical protein [Selenomonadaceae bacterium]
MTDQEKFNAELQMKTNLQEAKFNMLVNELKEQREDIRQINAKIDSKFDNLSNQIHSLTVAAVVGFGALALAVGGLVISLLSKNCA